jgi:Cytochrome P450
MKRRGRISIYVRCISIVKSFCCSTAVAWTLFAPSCQPAVQTALHAELRTCPTDSPTMEQLNSLPYSEGVVRKSLRLYSPVSFSQRNASHDAVIPLQKSLDKDGVLQNTVRCERPFLNTACALEWLMMNPMKGCGTAVAATDSTSEHGLSARDLWSHFSHARYIIITSGCMTRKTERYCICHDTSSAGLSARASKQVLDRPSHGQKKKSFVRRDNLMIVGSITWALLLLLYPPCHLFRVF